MRRLADLLQEKSQGQKTMKKTASTVTLISVLLLSALIAIQFTELASANPYIPGYFPLEPVTTQPTINVNHPVQNQIYETGDLDLNFSIIKPEAWFIHDVAYAENGSSLTLAIGQVTSVSYQLDDGEPQNMPLNDGNLPLEYVINTDPNRILNFSIHFTFPEGLHTARISFQAKSFYYTGWDDPDPGLRSIAVNGSSETVYFRVGHPFPATLVFVASVGIALVVVSLLVLFKKCSAHKSI
jgi:hypothetical protein